MHLHLKPVAMKDIDTFELAFSNREGASTYQWREGAWHDQLLFSLLRNEWELASPHELCEGK